MVYHRKSNRGSYSKEKLKEAVQEVQSGRLSGSKAAKIYLIPRMTIMDHVKKRRLKSTTLGRNTALSPEIECNLATSLKTMEKYGFGLSRKEVLELVGDYINQNDLVTPFKNGVPGKDWFLGFKHRHGLSIKKPQAVEYARKKAMDPFIIYPYFDILEKTIIDLNLQDKPSSIWNLDETSFSKDPSKTKIVGAKGYAATRVISTAGKSNTTVLLGASASGEKTPPLIIYKGKNVWDTWTSPKAYPGTSYAATSNGWMETEVFESFFKKTFLPTVQGRRPLLLIYDGHSTHVGLNLIEEARKENITILKLPPHSSHILQPLDVSVMKSFKDRWDFTLVLWQRLNVGNVMPKSEFAKLIGQVWAEIHPQVLRNGFLKAGIYPVNRNVIDLKQFDSLKLQQWKEWERKEKTENTKKSPERLQRLALNLINQIQLGKHSVTSENTVHDHTIFEELLLQKVKCSSSTSPKPRRQKVAPGAEVITNNDVLEKKKEEKRKKLQIEADKMSKKGKEAKFEKPTVNVAKENDLKKKRQENKNNKTHVNKNKSNEKKDVIYLKDCSRNDSQMQSFIAKDLTDLPSCLQTRRSHSPKIKILSSIVIKPPNKVNKEKEPCQKSHVHAKNKTYFDSSKPGPSGLCKPQNRPKSKSKVRRSSSTTSVSGSISSYTDSDIIDIDSDSLIDDGEEYNFNILAQTLNTKEKRSRKKISPKIEHSDDEHKVIESVYCSGDNVLVRYHIRQKWTYYVGKIETQKIINNELYYSVIFYKTIKKPILSFRITKKVDRDDVPATLIEKKVDLVQNPETLNFVFADFELNSIYF